MKKPRDIFIVLLGKVMQDIFLQSILFRRCRHQTVSMQFLFPFFHGSHLLRVFNGIVLIVYLFQHRAVHDSYLSNIVYWHTLRLAGLSACILLPALGAAFANSSVMDFPAFLGADSGTAAVINIHNRICGGKLLAVYTCGIFPASNPFTPCFIRRKSITILLAAGRGHKEVLFADTAPPWIMPVM